MFRRSRLFFLCWPGHLCCWSASVRARKWSAKCRTQKTRRYMVEAGDAVRRTIEVPAEAAGQRLDQFLTAHLDGVSRSRVQLLMEHGDVLVNGEREKASMKLRGGERITVSGEPRPAPLRATAEDIPLDVVYEDADLAVV